MSKKPIVEEILLPYQLRWVRDPARFKIGMWSRQTGKSFATACEAVLACQAKPGDMWVVLSAGERQALEWMRKAVQWAEAVKLAVDSCQEVRGAADALMTRGEITFANKSRIIAIPANPDTARGYSANLVLDEFAIHEKPFDIWAAIYPSITNPLNGKKVLRIVSTPKGRGNKFADLWEHNANYSRHKETIIDAAREGLPVNIEELKAGIDDPDIWAQEYLCEFIDSSAVLLPYDMIGKVESQTLIDPGDVPLFIGMDVGRSHDLSVIITGAMIGDVLHIVDVTELSRMPFAEQLQCLCSKASESRVRRVSIDATGIGAMLAEECRRKIGGRVEPVLFTSATKADMYSGMRRRFEDRTIRIPVSRDLREDLHAVQKLTSTGGTIRYAAPRNADGHSDRAAALALCIRAASRRGVEVPPIMTGRPMLFEEVRI